MNFNKNFYPTPKTLVKKMVEKAEKEFKMYYKGGYKILEPSTGTGNIVEVIKEKFPNSNIDCLELDDNIRAILKENIKVWNERNKNRHSNVRYGEINIVGDDFLANEYIGSYNLIIMNPPFDNGDKHLIKAIKMQERFGGNIVCLLNAETIKNPYSNIRQDLIKLIKKHDGEIEYIQNAFSGSGAERKTNVEVALITINVKGNYKKNFDFDRLHNDEEKTFEQKTNEVATRENSIEEIVESYNKEMKEAEKFYQHYLQVEKFGWCHLSDSRDRKIYFENIHQKINKDYWEKLFERKEFTDKLTNDNYYKWIGEIDRLKTKAFTIFNINEIKGEILKTALDSVKKGAVELFEKFTNHWFYDDKSCTNKWFYNGWKTNKAYIVGMKAKYPYNCIDGIMGYITYDCKRWLNDFDKVFDLFNYGEITWNGEKCGDIVEKQFKKQGTGVFFETKYCEVKVFAKGTIDFKFKKEARDIVKRFNIFCCKEKSWLPHNFGKEYENCDNEEKQAINNFYKVFNEDKKNNDYSLEYAKDRLNQTMIGIEMK